MKKEAFFGPKEKKLSYTHEGQTVTDLRRRPEGAMAPLEGREETVTTQTQNGHRA